MRTPGPAHDKSSLRRHMRWLATQHSSRSETADLEHRLSLHPRQKVIASFAAMPGEPDLLPLLDSYSERCWCFPKVHGETMSFHVVSNRRDLQPGAYGILEPTPQCRAVELGEIDLFLCPGMAFTSDRQRLGRGKGYYDRALAQASPHCTRLGLAFPWQIVPDVFAEPHDISMDGVILV